jgi:hypothetical protein
MYRFLQLLLASALGSLIGYGVLLMPCLPAWAGPVEWHEVAASGEGRQWWDSGSLRTNKSGNITVLSRYQSIDQQIDSSQSPGQPNGAQGQAAKQPNRNRTDLYVMEIDCGQRIYRDTSINGIPQFKGTWLPSGGDKLIDGVVSEACGAAGPGV